MGDTRWELVGSYKEYPVYFIFMILFALIAVGYFDNNLIVIVLSVAALILVYIYLPRALRTNAHVTGKQTNEHLMH
jgi:positive regulator of sigma E activity